MTCLRYEGISSAMALAQVSNSGFTWTESRGDIASRQRQTRHAASREGCSIQKLYIRLHTKAVCEGVLIPQFIESNDIVKIKQTRASTMQPRRLEFTPVVKNREVEVESQCIVKRPLVKICGITNLKDATSAVEAGARLVGMILWPRSKRSVSVDIAKEISHAVRLHKAEPVGVFVDEDAETIERFCNEADIGIAQLHGDGARASLANLPSHLATIYVLHVDKSGIVRTPLPEANSVDWILLDGLQGGSGHTFDWEKLKDLSLNSKRGWLLAGGLKPENVATAISILNPDFVDVSSGVTMSDGLLKDPTRVLAFMNAVKGCRNFL